MTNLLGLLVGLSLLLSNINGRVDVTMQQRPWDTNVTPEVVIFGVFGQVDCIEGRWPRMQLAVQASPANQVHEYAHVWDCLDNGKMDGSPLPSGADLAIIPQTEGCFRNMAEKYACWYTEWSQQWPP